MSAIVDALFAKPEDDALGRLAALLAPCLAARHIQDTGTSRWLNGEQAARYLAFRGDRLSDPVQIHKLEPRRAGLRLLLRPSGCTYVRWKLRTAELGDVEGVR